MAPSRQTTPEWEPPPGATPDSRSYKERPGVGPRGVSAPRACVRGAGLTHTGQPLRLVPLPLGYADLEPPPGVEPGHPRYEGGAAAVRGGKAEEPGFEPRPAGPEPAVLPVTPFPIECGRRDSNPHQCGF
jgi:hypothetical protein